jgi:hypothetical protein
MGTDEKASILASAAHFHAQMGFAKEQLQAFFKGFSRGPARLQGSAELSR